jgi:hypothetical protein
MTIRQLLVISTSTLLLLTLPCLTRASLSVKIKKFGHWKEENKRHEKVALNCASVRDARHTGEWAGLSGPRIEPPR